MFQITFAVYFVTAVAYQPSTLAAGLIERITAWITPSTSSNSLSRLGAPSTCEAHVQQIGRLQVLPELDDPRKIRGLGGDPRVSMGAPVLSQV